MPDKLSLPPGVNWEDSPLFDFGKRPVLTLLPDMMRLLTVGYLIRQYGKVDVPDTQIEVLDVAAGFGELGAILRAERKAKGSRIRYVAVDIDPRKRDRARVIYPSIDYRMADLSVPMALGNVVRGEDFDIVASTETLEHLTMEQGVQFMLDCLQLLKPGGTFILTSANPNIHRTNEWHLFEWPPEVLRTWLSEHASIVDWFYLKGPSVSQRQEFAKSRVPSEFLRALPNPAQGSVTVAVLRNK